MERLALKRLMADIEAEKIDVIVIYKIKRLTRSLADFSKMVEVFERKGVSFVFVSATQQFNTTMSMGRLMLNVLLSCAQFQREVTGERRADPRQNCGQQTQGLVEGWRSPSGVRRRQPAIGAQPQGGQTCQAVGQSDPAARQHRMHATVPQRSLGTSPLRAHRHGNRRRWLASQ